jgi:hypothetical protein
MRCLLTQTSMRCSEHERNENDEAETSKNSSIYTC